MKPSISNFPMPRTLSGQRKVIIMWPVSTLMAQIVLLRPKVADNEAWYTANGVCSLSELELSQAQLEKEYNAVFTAWKTTPYFAEGYHIDDIDLLQRNNDASRSNNKSRNWEGRMGTWSLLHPRWRFGQRHCKLGRWWEPTLPSSTDRLHQ